MANAATAHHAKIPMQGQGYPYPIYVMRQPSSWIIKTGYSNVVFAPQISLKF